MDTCGEITAEQLRIIALNHNTNALSASLHAAAKVIERLQYDLTTAQADKLAMQNLIHRFDVAICMSADALGGAVCGGVDTDDSPGGHTGKVLAEKARELVLASAALDWLLEHYPDVPWIMDQHDCPSYLKDYFKERFHFAHADLNWKGKLKP